MTAKLDVEDFLAQKTLAIVGVSRKGNKYGNAALKELKAKGYKVIPVHPKAESIEGERCYPGLSALPEPVGGVLVVVHPAEAEKVVQEAAAAGIKRVWLQQGAQSEKAVRFCKEHGISVVSKECILMFAQPAGMHNFHRWVWSILGKLPK